MVGKDNVLITITTAANMGGIEQAKAGLLGLNVATLGLTVAVAGAVMAGKSMVEIAMKQDEAHKSLVQAITYHNSQIGKTSVATKDVTKEINAHEAALKALERIELGMPARHKATALQLFNLGEAQKQVAKTATALAEAEKPAANAIDQTKTSVAEAEAYLHRFIASNRSYISSQSEVEDGYGALLRSGVPVAEAQKDMNRAVDLAAIKGISLADAVSLIQKAEEGRLRGLIDLGISTGKYTDAEGNLINKSKDVAAAMAEVDAKTAKGRDTLTQIQQVSNRLSNDWQDLARIGGPVLEKELEVIIGFVDSIYNAFDRIGRDNNLWAAISDRLVKMAQGLREAALQLGIAQPVNADFKPGTASYQAENAKEYSQAYTGAPGNYLPAGSGAPYGFDPRNGFAWSTYGSGPGQTRPPSNPGFGKGSRASGGPVLPGRSYTVGESAMENLTMFPGGGGYVTPTAGGRSGSGQVHVHLEGIYAGDGPSLDILANKIALRLGYATGR